MPNATRILLVDDDLDDRELFNEAVKEIDRSIELTFAMNGESALKLLNQNETPPDYIFLDLNMPKMDGKQFLKLLKTNGRFQPVPVIIYSTSKLDVDIEETKRSGAIHFITKPISFSILIDSIRFVLSKKWQLSRASS